MLGKNNVAGSGAGGYLKSITVTHMPDVTKFIYQHPLDTTGLIVTGTFDDGKTLDVTSWCTYSVNTGSITSLDLGANTVYCTIGRIKTQYSIEVVKVSTVTLTANNDNWFFEFYDGWGLSFRNVYYIDLENVSGKTLKKGDSPVVINSAVGNILRIYLTCSGQSGFSPLDFVIHNRVRLIKKDGSQSYLYQKAWDQNYGQNFSINFTLVEGSYEVYTQISGSTRETEHLYNDICIKEIS